MRCFESALFADYETYMRYAPKSEAEIKVEQKVYRCSCCGKEFGYQPVVSIQLPYFPNLASHGEDNYRAEWAYACSERCAWLDAIQRHKAWGMTEEEARTHLIGDHALTPPA